jgi:hypothetical protein
MVPPPAVAPEMHSALRRNAGGGTASVPAAVEREPQADDIVPSPREQAPPISGASPNHADSMRDLRSSRNLETMLSRRS